MNGFLPIYKNLNSKESLLPGNNGEWRRSFFAQKGNLIPAFQSEFSDQFISLTSVILRKLNPDNILTITKEIHITLQFISITNKTINGVIYSSITNKSDFFFSDIEEEKGIFDLKVTTNTGDVFYSDIFQLAGIPIATHSCTNANFDADTNIFSIDISRVDINQAANNNAQFILRFLNSFTSKYVGQIIQNISLNIGETVSYNFLISGITQEFDFFVWSGVCSGSIEITILQFEDTLTLQTEDNFFIISQ